MPGSAAPVCGVPAATTRRATSTLFAGLRRRAQIARDLFEGEASGQTTARKKSEGWKRAKGNAR